MNKIVNGVANDYEFPMYYESNIKTSRDKTIGEDLSKQIIKMENVYVDFVRKKDKEIERLNNIINKYEEKIQMLDSVCSSLEFSAPENDYIFKGRLREIIDKLKELKENK